MKSLTSKATPIFPLILLLILALTPSCTKTSSTPQAIQSMTAREARGMQKNDFAVIVDVREADEVKGGMAEGALWFPTSKVEDAGAWKDFVAKLPKDKEIVFYCAAGGRAQAAAEKLAKEGYKTANMGGYRGWVGEGFPIQKPKP